MPRVTELHRSEQRERILLAAARCFSRRGFHVTSMDDVITEAGLSAGAVYGYYRGKDQLIEAAARRAMELVDEVLPRLGASPSPEVLLERLLSTIVEVAERSGFDPTRVAMQAWGESVRNPAVRELVQAAYLALRAHLAEAVRGWQRTGAVAAEADPDEVAKMLFGLVPGFIVQRQLLGDVEPAAYAAALRAFRSGGAG